MSDKYSVYSQFDIDKHCDTFINYLEVIVRHDGTVEYAVPSHTEKLIQVLCELEGLTRQEVIDQCPSEYMFDCNTWLCTRTGCVSVWTEGYIATGELTTKQKHTLSLFVKRGIMRNVNMHRSNPMEVVCYGL